MQRIVRTLLIASALALPLAACETAGDNWLSDFFDTKKKLPGERRAVFPEGVPGVDRGVPAELVRGAQPRTEDPDTASQAAIVDAPKETPKAKAKPKPKPAPKTAASGQQQKGSTTQGSGQQQPAATQWPDPPGGTRQQTPAGGGGVQWPDPPPTR